MSKHKAPSRQSRGSHRGPSSWSVRPMASLGALVATALVAAMTVGIPGSASAANRNFVVNPGFEHGAHGWRTNDKASQHLSTSPLAHRGSEAAKLTVTATSNAVLNDRVNSVDSTKAGVVYRARAWVRTDKAPLSGQLRIRERKDGVTTSVGRQVFQLTDTQWHAVRLNYTARTDGAALDLNVLARHLSPQSSLLVDSVRLAIIADTEAKPDPVTSTTTAGRPAGSTSSTATSTSRPSGSTSSATPTTSKPTATGTTSAPTTNPNCSPRFPGDPCAGKLYYGASVSGGDPTVLEAKIGGKLALYRSYMSATSSAAKFVSRASNDVANGRVPLISTKVPGTWADVAAGKYDSWLLERIKGLATVKGPVWLALHHEPRNDGAPADWVAMQQHARKLIDANSTNIALIGILNGWDFKSAKGNPEAFNHPVGTGVDVMGFDAYNPWSPSNGKSWQEPSYVFSPALTIQKWGYPTLVGEYGVRSDPSDPGRAATWMRDAYDFAVAHGFVAMSYFDSAQNSPDGTWELDSETLAPFAQQLKAVHTASLK